MKRLALLSAASGVVAGVISALTGGWNLALEALGIVMLLDYITGLIVAGIFHKSPKSKGGALESKAAFKGLLKKALIVVIVVLFHQIDRLTGKSFFRDGACWSFFVAEAISVVENVGLVYRLPAFISKSLEWLNKKSDALTGAIPGKTDKAGENDNSDVRKADVSEIPESLRYDEDGNDRQSVIYQTDKPPDEADSSTSPQNDGKGGADNGDA